jgi:hypothetical protein
VQSARDNDAFSQAQRSGGIRLIVANHLESEQVSRVIYGSIIGLALVVALEAHPPPAGAVIATLVGTSIAVGMAELYSEVIGLQVSARRRARPAERRELRGDIAAVMVGIAFPALFFLLAAAGAFDDETAFTVAKWTGLGLIALYGFVGARVSGAGTPRALLQASAAALIGGLLIALKALVH